MDTKQRVLVVDDDDNIAELISLYLEKECYETKTAADGDEAVKLFSEWKPELLILDIMLPKRDGYEVLREIRKTSKVPVIMLSAKGEVFDRVLGLELGADDYMVKPFDTKELLARVHAVLRRYESREEQIEAVPSNVRQPENGGSHMPKTDRDSVSYEELFVSLSNYEVIYKDEKLEMPPKEIELLYFLANHPNQVFSRDQLLERIWGYDYSGDTRTVDVHIKRLRDKLPGNAFWQIGTVWGVGYRFEVVA